jgi:hypothetical protein
MPPKTVQEPIFLLGAHRSGTTLLGLMLRGHSSIGWIGECEYLVDFIEPETGDFPVKHEFHRMLQTDRRFRARAFDIEESLAPRELADSLLVQTMEGQGKTRIGGAVHRHFDRILNLWPDARVIHLIRDGRDVALSRINLGWAGNAWSSAPAWAEIERSWDALSPRLAPGQAFELRYEELVRDPSGHLERLCAFLSVDYEPEMLNYPARSTYEAPDPSLAQQWRTRLSPRECQLLDGCIGDVLVRRGYPLGSSQALEPGLLEESALRVQDWSSRLLWRLNRYGARLVVTEFVTRKFGLQMRNQNLRLQIDAIAERHLR